MISLRGMGNGSSTLNITRLIRNAAFAVLKFLSLQQKAKKKFACTDIARIVRLEWMEVTTLERN